MSLLRLEVKVVTRSRRPGFLGIMADGTIRIGLSSPPVDGRANRELLGFIAEELGVPVSSVSITSGAGSRRKRLAVRDPGRRPEWLRSGRD